MIVAPVALSVTAAGPPWWAFALVIGAALGLVLLKNWRRP